MIEEITKLLEETIEDLKKYEGKMCLKDIGDTIDMIKDLSEALYYQSQIMK